MAQAFQTIYKKNYRKHPFCKRDLIKQIDEFTEKPPSDGNWRIESTDDKKIQGRSRLDLEEQVNMFYNKNYKTTYFTSYCHDEAKDTFDDSDEETADELINRGIRVFKKKSKKIAPPLCTSRRLWGYMRPDSLYVPLSTYQNTYDRLAYNRIKDGPPQDDYQAMLEENQQLSGAGNNLKSIKDSEPGNGLEIMDPVTKAKLNRLDGLSRTKQMMEMKKRKARELLTLNGVVCGRPAVFTMMN